MSGTVVTLGDASLTTADLSLLVPPNWLNDQIISFWFEYLRIKVANENPAISFVLPNVAYFIALTDGKSSKTSKQKQKNLRRFFNNHMT